MNSKIVLWIGVSLSLVARADVEIVDLSQKAEPPPLSIEQRLAQVEKRVSAEQPVEWINRLEQLQHQFETLHGQFEVQTHRMEKMQAALEKMQQHANANATSPLALTGDENADYRAIYHKVLDKQYKEARQGFVDYLARYPSGRYTPNAYYWLGELQLKAADYEQALISFTHLIRDYPKNLKVADALLKQGYIYYAMGKWTDARQVFEKVSKRYPDSASAKLALVRLQQMDSQGL